jgi:FkbM family methyltransferase
VLAFFRDIPMRPQRQEVRNILRESLLAALVCQKMWGPLSSSAKKVLDECAPLRARIRFRYSKLPKIADEILCSAHGLRTLNPQIQQYLSPRAVLDIGAFIGDSAVILIDFAKDVYSFEPGPSNFIQLVKVIAQNRNHTGTAHPVNLGLSDAPGKLAFQDIQSSEAAFGIGGVEVNITTVDLYVETHNIRVGFVKCDTEGHGLPIVRGAEKTLKNHRSIVSFSICHNFYEFFGIPRLLRTWLPNYEFWWEFGVNDIGRWHELIFMGYPSEITDFSF